MTRKWILAIAGATVAGSMLTCGPDKAGEMLVDAGRMLVDGGEGLIDAAGERDARAAPVDITCTEYVRTITDADGGVTVITTWISHDSGLGAPDDPADVDVLRCDLQYFGGAPDYNTCPAGSTCTGTHPGAQNCYTIGPSFQDGQPFVYCGQRSESTPSGGSTTTSGHRYQTVKIIPR